MSIRVQILEYSRAPVINGIIVGVKIIGTRSKNDRIYPQNMLHAAMSLYENTSVYMLHGSEKEIRQRSRRHVDHFGSLQNIVEGFDGKIGLGLFGDLHIKQSHPMAQLVIESDGSQFGLSHNVIAELNDDKTEVLEILEVNSVDLVEDPATTINLFEQEESEEMERKELEALVKANFDALNAQLTTILEAVKKERAKQPARHTALEHVTEGDEGQETLPTYGLSHEDFLAGLKGISEGARA